MIQETSTPRNEAERALFDEIHNVKAERMKAEARGDLHAVSACNVRIGELTGQVHRMRWLGGT